MKALFVALVGAVLLHATTAHADGSALRGPSQRNSIAITYGQPGGSIAVMPFRFAGFALSWRVPGYLGLSTSSRFILRGGETGWAFEATTLGGFGLASYGPSPELHLTVALAARYQRPAFYFSIGAVVPTSFRVAAPIEVRIPTLLECWLAGRVGRLWFGGFASAGAAFVPDLSPSVDVRWGMYAATALW